jgi:hypothetical protein
MGKPKTPHTPGLLQIIGDDRITISRHDGRHIANTASFAISPDEQIANAARIVACWNAFDGLTNEQIGFWGSISHLVKLLAKETTERNKLRQERDLLHAMLKELVELKQMKDNPVKRSESTPENYRQRKSYAWKAAKQLINKEQ